MLETLNSLWVGDRLRYMEQLCILSALDLGHPFRLYSYTPEILHGVPAGVDLRDAREIMPIDKLVRDSSNGAVQPGSDIFRYILLTKESGYWVDMDFYFLKPLDFDEDYVFGWQNESAINNAILRIPANSNMASDLCNLPKTNWCPPWLGPKSKFLYYWRRFTKGDIKLENLGWATLGPGLVTYLAKKHGVAEKAQERTMFYPVKYEDAHVIFEPADEAERMLTSRTRAVHFWQAKLVGRLAMPPPLGSYLDLACRRYGIEYNKT